MRRRPHREGSDNTLLWQFNRRRLEAEEIRDAMLAVAGRLNPKAGGPSVMVPIDPELVQAALQALAVGGRRRTRREHDRRSVYLIAKRNLRLPFMEVFDAPDTLIELRAARIEHARAAGAGTAERRSRNDLAEAFAERLRARSWRATRASRSICAYRLAAGPRRRPRRSGSSRWSS